MVIVSVCQLISMAKGLAEGAEDGVRDKLCGSVCIGPYGSEYQGSANLHEPEGAREIDQMKGLFFVISRAALLLNRSELAASEELRPLQTLLPYSIPGMMLNT